MIGRDEGDKRAIADLTTKEMATGNAERLCIWRLIKAPAATPAILGPAVRTRPQNKELLRLR